MLGLLAENKAGSVDFQIWEASLMLDWHILIARVFSLGYFQLIIENYKHCQDLAGCLTTHYKLHLMKVSSRRSYVTDYSQKKKMRMKILTSSKQDQH